MKLSETVEAYVEVTEFCGVRHETIGEYQVNEIASILPMMSETEFSELCDSMKEHGMVQAIKLDASGKILDGRNRMLACCAIEIEPHFINATMDDLNEVIIDNLRRRNMTPGARAMAWLKINGIPSDEKDEAVEENTTAGANEPEPATTQEKKKSASPRKKSQKQAADEAGVSIRSMTDAKSVYAKATDEVKEAVSTGAITPSQGAALTELAEDEQKEIVGKEDANEIRKEAIRAEKEVKRSKKMMNFDMNKWKPVVDKKVSIILANVPPDLKDRCKKHLQQTLGSTVRLERDTESMLDAVSIVPYIEEIIGSLAKSEKASSERAIAEHYSSVVKIKDAESGMESIKAIMEGLSDREKKKLSASIVEAYAGEVKQSTKAGEYLPALPNDHVAAVEVVGKEFKSRVDGLLGFEEWEMNGRRNAGKAWKKSVQNQLKRMTVHAGLDIEEGAEVPVMEFPEHLSTDTFRAVWAEFVASRKKEKKTIGDGVQKRQLNILAHFDEQQASEIVAKAIEGSWKGIPVYSDLATTAWCGRKPAFPPAGETTTSSRLSSVPTKPSNSAPDRSQHGKLNTSSVPKKSIAEKIAAMRE